MSDATSSDTNTQALADLVGLVVDTVNDTESVIEGGSHNTFAIIGAFGPLLPEVMKLLPEIGDLPSEIKGMDPDDAQKVVQVVESKLKVPGQKAQDITNASLKVLEQLSGPIFAAIEDLVKAVKEK